MFVMQRKMMLGIKQRAEGTRPPAVADVLVPLSWFAAGAVASAHGARAVRNPKGASVHAGLAGISAVAVQGLLFWDMPGEYRAALLLALVASLRMTPRKRCP